MKDWDAIYGEKGVLQTKPNEFVTETLSVLEENNVKRVLDLGCGTGRHMTLLLDEGFEVHGTDASPKAIEILTGILNQRGVENVELKVGDFTNIEWPEKYFDAVVCTNVIQHGRMDDIGHAAEEIHRVLKKDGILLLQTLSTKDGACGVGDELEAGTFITGVEPDGDIPHHFFTQEELRDLFRGFQILSLNEREWKPELRNIEKGVCWELVGKRL